MADTFEFEIVAPAASMLSEPAELVIIPGAEGNFGVMPGHAPLLSMLRPGTIEIRDRSLKVLEQIFVEGGFAEVTPERCTILAEEALPVREITREEAETRLNQNARTLSEQSATLAAHLAKGDGYDRTLDYYRGLREVADDTQEMLPQAAFAELSLNAWAKVSDLLRQLAGYYEP